jgi:hypothetical protein
LTIRTKEIPQELMDKITSSQAQQEALADHVKLTCFDTLIEVLTEKIEREEE